jgi:hypothetical protein
MIPSFWVKMLFRNNYTSNFDYETTLEKLENSNLIDKVIVSEGATSTFKGKGIISVKTKGSNKWCLVRKKTVQIMFENGKEKEHILTVLRPLLRKKNNMLAFLEPADINVSAKWKEVERGDPIPFSACPKTYLYTLQSIKTKLSIRKGVPPLLWVLLFLMFSLLLIPKFLELL